MAQHTSRSRAPWNLNHLRLGSTYRATTVAGTTAGEYLGMETPYSDRSILLRNGSKTASIALSDLTNLSPSAA